MPAPLDTETIYNSVRKTHRAVVVYEDWKSGGFGAEIAARIGEDCFDDLGRTGWAGRRSERADALHQNLELECIPNEQDVIAAVRKIR